MKKAEKTNLTIKRILDAGIQEFGKGSYDSVSINTILENHGISKGLFYHNFKSKDELYLAVVKLTFDEMIRINSEETREEGNTEDATILVIRKRHKFFRDNPLMANIFFTALFKTPPHLANKLKEVKKEFDETSKKFIMSLPIKDDIDPLLAANCVLFFQEIFNLYYANESKQHNDFKRVVTEHESTLQSLIEILFHGLLKDPETVQCK